MEKYSWDNAVSNLLHTWEGAIRDASFVEHGFWGLPNTTHQFCEPNYAFSYYGVESVNAFSSIISILCAFKAHRQIQPRGESMKMISLACLWLGIIGCGSLLFHLTMRYSMQLLDEVPMVCLMATLLANKVDKLKSAKKHATFWQRLIGGYAFAIVLAYVTFGQYLLF